MIQKTTKSSPDLIFPCECRRPPSSLQILEVTKYSAYIHISKLRILSVHSSHTIYWTRNCIAYWEVKIPKIEPKLSSLRIILQEARPIKHHSNVSFIPREKRTPINSRFRCTKLPLCDSDLWFQPRSAALGMDNCPQIYLMGKTELQWSQTRF